MTRLRPRMFSSCAYQGIAPILNLSLLTVRIANYLGPFVEVGDLITSAIALTTLRPRRMN